MIVPENDKRRLNDVSRKGLKIQYWKKKKSGDNERKGEEL